MDYSALDAKKLDEYAARARAAWGDTPEYREFERRIAGRAPAEMAAVSEQMMAIFAEFGALRGGSPASEEARRLVVRLQDFITAHFYTCSDAVLAGLGQMYAAGGEMTASIDRYGGDGTAAFAAEAIRAHCAR